MTSNERSLCDLAILLLAEASGAGEHAPPAAQVLQQLDVVLVRVAGQAGSRSLMERALSMAQANAPSLTSLRIPPAGPINGIDWRIARNAPLSPHNDQVILVTHVLELLKTFIGERLTLQLVKEAWPDLDQNSDVVPLDPTP